MDGQTKSDFERDEINKIPRLIGEQTKTSLLFISYELCCIQTRKKKTRNLSLSQLLELLYFPNHLPDVFPFTKRTVGEARGEVAPANIPD